MNVLCVSGYLPADPVERVSPDGKRKLAFDVRVMDSRRHESTQKCFVEEPELGPISISAAPLMKAGRAVWIHGEVTDRPYMERGVVKSLIREVRVMRIELPDRSRQAAPAAEQEDGA